MTIRVREHAKHLAISQSRANIEHLRHSNVQLSKSLSCGTVVNAPPPKTGLREFENIGAKKAMEVEQAPTLEIGSE